jgi:hypothetical protein
MVQIVELLRRRPNSTTRRISVRLSISEGRTRKLLGELGGNVQSVGQRPRRWSLAETQGE